LSLKYLRYFSQTIAAIRHVDKINAGHHLEQFTGDTLTAPDAVVEAYRDQAGKTQHRTVLNFGRKDLLAAHLDLTKLQRLLHGDDRSGSARREDIEAIGAWDWGPMLAARAMWRELGLDTMLDKRDRRERRDVVGLSDRALVLRRRYFLGPGRALPE
jgi:hypothetical protein